MVEVEENYGNLAQARSTCASESIPVEKLEWYTRTNKAAIRDQYQVLLQVERLLSLTFGEYKPDHTKIQAATNYWLFSLT